MDILKQADNGARIDLSAQLSVLYINRILKQLWKKNVGSFWCKIGGKMTHNT